MKKIAIFLLFVSYPTLSADWYIGIGEIYQADKSGYNMYSASIEKGKWKFGLSHWETYPQTAWLEDHPEWGIDLIEKHSIASLSRTLFDYQLSDNISFFFDFGLAYVNKTSNANSSHMNFRENIGFKFKHFQLYFRHTSNANVKSPNRGEDAFVLEYRLDF